MKLTTTLKTLLATLAIASPALAGTAPSPKAPAPVAPPPEEDLGITVGLGYDSSFIFRGVEFGEHWITGSVGVDIPVVDKVSFGLDASYGSLADDNDAILGGLSYQRLEIGAGLTYDAGAAEVGLGYRWYHQMGDLDALLEDGHEVGLTLASALGPVNVGLGAYYDFAVDGWYFELAANTEIKITDSFSLVPGASVGYGVDYTWHIDLPGAGAVIGDGFTAVNLSLAAPIKLSSRATLTPYIAGNLPIDNLEDLGEDDKLYGGVSLSVRF